MFDFLKLETNGVCLCNRFLCYFSILPVTLHPELIIILAIYGTEFRADTEQDL